MKYIPTLAAVFAVGTLAASAASANTVLGDLDTTLVGGSGYVYQSFDINNDGYNDIDVSIYNGRASLSGVRDYTFNNVQPAGLGLPITISDTEILFKNDGGSAALWAAGDTVTTAGSNGPDDYAVIYGSSSTAAGDNLLPNVGDSGYYGFVTQFGNATGDFCDGLCGYTFDSTPAVIYSFLKIEHGSVILSTFGYNAAGGAVIPGSGQPPISSVPLPASALLLLAGLGGMGALRRKRTS